MTKGNIENSLKRFLKRKIKFTLGLMITFLITGAVSFSDDESQPKPPQTIEDYYIENNLEGILTSQQFLTGLGTEINLDKEITAGTTKITSDNNGGIVITFSDKNITIEKDKISSLAGNIVQNTLKHVDTDFNNVKIEETDKMGEEVKKVIRNYNDGLNLKDGTDVSINKGILITGQNKKKFMYNYGIIANNGDNAQSIGNIGYNYGIIINKGNTGQNIAIESTGYNYGIIANNGKEGQQINKTGYNYGIIANIGEKGQDIRRGEGYNYGIINNLGTFGQNVGFSDTKKGIGYNYGIISNVGNYGQRAHFGSIYNYGIITNTGHYGQRLETTGTEAKNYGLIANSGEYAIYNAGNGTAINYGVVKNSTGKVFSGNVTNYGLVILTDKEFQENGLGKGTNNGIILDKNHEAIGNDVTIFDKENNRVANFEEDKTFGSNTKGYVKNITVQIDNVVGKILGAVVTKNSDFSGAVFNYAGNEANGNELYINNTVMTGYFEKNGTLLDVNGNKVTLRDTTITAVKDDMSLDVWAVDVTNGGQLSIMGDNVKINGLINADKDATISFVSSNQKFKVNGGNVEIGIADSNSDSSGSRYQQSFDVTLAGDTPDVENSSVNEIKISTENAVAGLANALKIEDSLTVKANKEGYSIYDTNDGSDEDHNNTNAELEISIGSIHNIKGNVALGVGKDTFKIENHDYCTIEDENHKDKIIDLGAGEDRFIAVGEAEKNVFAYNVKNAETIELQGGVWTDWDHAGTISFDNVTKENSKPNFVLGKDTTIEITFNDKGSDFERHIEKLTANGELGIDHTVIHGTDETSVVKYRIDETTGLDMNNLSSTKYSFDDKINFENQSSIFNIKNDEGDRVTITIKSAEDFGFSSQERIIYEAYIKQIKADGNIDEDAQKVIAQINKLDFQGFKEQIQRTKVSGEAYYTAGSVLAKDITNTYVSAVQDFTKRAEKGQWLAQGKYLNSDTEFNGGKEVKGYDGDITGTVGMIEYGVTENTSYGVVFGKGDTEMDIDGGGKLDGDNTYAGLYAKHRTGNGIEFTADIGYMENNMDSLLRNDFNFSNKSDTNPDGISSSGKTFEKGTADSSSVSFGVKGRKDYKISDTVKLQPTLGARLTFINQEEAENPEMFFTIEKQDIMVFEGTAGMGIVKEIALSHGAVQLNAGAEYTFAASSSTNDAEYTLFKDTDEKPLTNPIEDTKTAENTGKLFVGADYEHENGVGFNGKYEMLWSDKGDDSRITAGMSYRF